MRWPRSDFLLTPLASGYTQNMSVLAAPSNQSFGVLCEERVAMLLRTSCRAAGFVDSKGPSKGVSSQAILTIPVLVYFYSKKSCREAMTKWIDQGNLKKKKKEKKKIYAKWKKPGTKDHILCDSLYIEMSRKGKIERGSWLSRAEEDE